MKENYIYIAINEGANLDLSIMKDFQSIIEKYRSDIDFIEYNLGDDEERKYIDYLE